MRGVTRARGRIGPPLSKSAGAACVLVLGSGLAQGQDVLETVSVTASRVVTSGFNAPTPTTVIGAAELERTAPIQISEALAQMPTFRTSGTPSTANVYANLRAIGPQRTLLLVDGRRHVPTQSDGSVDLNLIPTSMIARSEVVTGGASASWGSDAVAGVVNLILKDDLQGLVGTAQGGMSKYEDAENFMASLAAGTRFAGDRGYVIAGAEYAKNKGIRGLQPPHRSRPWSGRGSLGNNAFAVNGQPGTLYSEDVRRADVSDGGLITSGPLRGLAFEPNGATRQFQFGQMYGNGGIGSSMIGGGDNYSDTPTPGGDLQNPFERYSFMTHVDYALTDNLKIFAEGTYARSIADGYTIPARNNGALTAQSCNVTTLASSLGSINVHINNAYLPASVRQQMQDAGISCFAMGRTFRDPGMGEFTTEDGSPYLYRGVVGMEGELPGNWSWDTYVQYGKNRFAQARIGNVDIARFRRAINAQVHPTTGQIVCADSFSATQATRDAAAGCVPFNLFGNGSPSQAAIDYVTGTSWLRSDTEQTVAAFTVRGEAGATWAGPINIASGVEYRKEEIDAVADAISQANGWQTSNRKAIAGDYNAKEIFGEAVLPLAADAAWAEQLDLNLAARYTDYSSSGGVTTWKAGLSWQINDQVRLRSTQSRDIRAGNLGELYTPTAVGIQNVRHPLTATVNPAPVTTTGNATLAPEEADTFTAGIVYEPSWLEGLRTSVDYYSIKIDGQIGTITAQQVADRCFLDNVASFCSQVTSAGNAITGVTVSFQNLDKFETSGFDVEMFYGLDGGRIHSAIAGDFSFRVLATYVDELATTASATSTVTDPSGQYTSPNWTVFTTLGYRGERFGSSVEVRWYEGGKIDNTRFEGQASARGLNINHVGSTAYTNLSMSYDLSPNSDNDLSVYLRVNNLFNRWPPFPNTGGLGIFDEVGRAYRLGVRFGF